MMKTGAETDAKASQKIMTRKTQTSVAQVLRLLLGKEYFTCDYCITE